MNTIIVIAIAAVAAIASAVIKVNILFMKVMVLVNTGYVYDWF